MFENCDIFIDITKEINNEKNNWIENRIRGKSVD